MVKDGQNLSTLFCKLNLSINDMREYKMKYFEVELTNPDEFLKQQTEDFVKANRWLLIKEDETYYLITQDDYSQREMIEKFRSVFEKKVYMDSHLSNLEILRLVTLEDIVNALENFELNSHNINRTIGFGRY